jgi:hypothetical protein
MHGVLDTQWFHHCQVGLGSFQDIAFQIPHFYICFYFFDFFILVFIMIIIIVGGFGYYTTTLLLVVDVVVAAVVVVSSKHCCIGILSSSHQGFAIWFQCVFKSKVSIRCIGCHPLDILRILRSCRLIIAVVVGGTCFAEI